MTRRLITTLLIAAVSFTPLVLAETIPTVSPEDVGLSTDRLARIGSVFGKHFDENRIPGTVSLIARQGKIGYFDTVGMQDLETKTPMAKDTIFRIYSMSKPITSVAVMMLFEEGHFLLTDPASKYLPQLGNLKVGVETKNPDTNETQFTTVPAESDMTIRDLLRHTSGLTYGIFGQSQVDKMYVQAGMFGANKTLADQLDTLGTLPLKHQPGTTWEYSVSTDVLGRLVEVVSGMPFDEFLQTRIFKPLAMPDTGFYVPVEKRDRFASMYSVDQDQKIKGLAGGFISRSYLEKPTAPSGGGGLVSTATDYLRFCQMMLNGGQLDGTRLLSRKTVELMTRDHLGPIKMGMGATGTGFGLGFAVVKDPGETGILGSIGEHYWGGAAGTGFWIDPQEQMIGVFMVQILPHTGLNYRTQYKAMAYQAIAD
jgi:CubicO group peptidase (beta-lactamase class C family)